MHFFSLADTVQVSALENVPYVVFLFKADFFFCHVLSFISCLVSPILAMTMTLTETKTILRVNPLSHFKVTSLGTETCSAFFLGTK